MFEEYKTFITKGNLVEIAAAFVVGVAFNQVVSTFTGRIVSPLVAMVFGLPDMTDMWLFGEIDEATGLPAGSFGAFVEVTLDFMIVGFVMFLVVRSYNRLERKAEEAEAAAPTEPSEDTLLLREIRDSLARD